MSWKKTFSTERLAVESWKGNIWQPGTYDNNFFQKIWQYKFMLARRMLWEKLTFRHLCLIFIQKRNELLYKENIDHYNYLFGRQWVSSCNHLSKVKNSSIILKFQVCSKLAVKTPQRLRITSKLKHISCDNTKKTKKKTQSVPVVSLALLLTYFIQIG